LSPGVGVAARELAERWFGLEEGVRAYDAIYRGMPRIHRQKGSLTDTAWPPGSVWDAAP
jgi:hypothetical protein